MCEWVRNIMDTLMRTSVEPARQAWKVVLVAAIRKLFLILNAVTRAKSLGKRTLCQR